MQQERSYLDLLRPAYDKVPAGWFQTSKLANVDVHRSKKKRKKGYAGGRPYREPLEICVEISRPRGSPGL